MVTIQEELKSLIKKALKGLFDEAGVAFDDSLVFSMEKPPQDDFGDYSSNAGFIIAKKLKTSPFEAANKIINELSKEKMSHASVKNEKGFLNFYLNDAYLVEKYSELDTSLGKKGKPVLDIGAGKKVNIEFLSSNPTGQPHVGNARSAFFGDTLANLYVASGYDVDKEFYVNDAKAGNQIQELGKTVLGLGESYKSEYLEAIIKKLKKTAKFKKISKDSPRDRLYGEVGFLAAQEIVAGFKKFAKKEMGIDYDIWFSEQKLHQGEKIEQAITFLRKKLNDKDLVYLKEGALWMRTTSFGDTEDRVLIKSSGQETYFAADIAYHKDKVERGYDIIIDIWGADHHGHKKKMESAVEMLGYKGKFEVLIAQMVSLKKDGKTAKLSKREGNIVTIAELLEEVPLDAVRVFYLTKSLDTHLEFDLNVVLEQSAKNPVYYLQYAYVRILSILKKAKIKAQPSAMEGLEKDERALVAIAARFPEVLKNAVLNNEPHLVFVYAENLAKTFHEFYNKCRVVGVDESTQARRVYIISSAKNIFERIFDIFGVSAPKKM
jgi:arginyl-tRNA synthetase